MSSRTLILIALLFSRAIAGGEDLPAWLREAVTRQGPNVATAPAVVLHDESTVTVLEGGKLLTQSSRAVRILKREGASEAVARAIYTTDTAKVKEFRAWLIRPSGDVKKYGKNDVADVALVNNDIYNEVRVKAISGRSDADPGAVFAFEFELEDKSMFTQFERTLAEDIPVLLARFTISLPAGWQLEAHTYNSPALKAAVMSGRHTWELRDLPALELARFGPSTRSQSPRIAASAIPPTEAAAGGVRSFSSWNDVAGWLYALADPQMAPDNALVEKAQSVTRDAKTEWEKIAAVARFVQSVQYVSIQTGTGRGGGYKPRPATLVLSRNYGDCKDKTNLMRAMLRVVGVEGYAVVIYAGDRTYVHEDWPSPQQFNHCIFAARLKEEASSPAVIEHPGLGKLVLFDPTDENTAFGLLPAHEEGSLALVAAPATSALLRTPSSESQHNKVERSLMGKLGQDGSLTATLREKAYGHAAAARNGTSSDPAGLRRQLEEWLSRYMTGAELSTLTPASTGGTTGFDASLTVPGFAQVSGSLFMFRPAPVFMGAGVSFAERTRTQPLRLQPREVSDVVTLTLPEGFEVDEMPPPIDLRSNWGKFRSACTVKERTMEVRRSLQVAGGEISPDDYPAARDFFDKVGGSARLPVVLVKK